MTKFGKCETCRVRKVKCDEEWPKCGACKKKGRECHYTYQKNSAFIYEHIEMTHRVSNVETSSSPTLVSSNSAWVEASPKKVTYGSHEVTLSLKRSRKAEHGSGAFHIFKNQSINGTRTESESACQADRNTNVPSHPLMPALLCPQTVVCAKWSSFFGIEALDLKPFGKWIRAAWLSAGEDECLDLASNYALESMQAFRCRNQTNLARACLARGRALRSLQIAVNSGEVRQSLIFAAMLHCAAEQFVNLGSYSFIPHALGVSTLVGICLENGYCNEAIRNIVHIICVTDIHVTIFMGRSSSLEKISRPDTPLDGPFQLDTAVFAVDYFLIMMPRLICLVRLAMELPADDKRISEAVTLANELYNSAADLYARKTLAMHMSTKSCSEGFRRSPNDYFFEFDSLPAFVLATRYNLYRVFLCGALQTLHVLDSSELQSNLNTVQQQDLTAAMSLAMSLDYALTPAASMPMTAAGILVPLEMAFQSWHRLQKRQKSTETAEYQLAVYMKDWTMENLKHVHSVWHNTPRTRERMEAVGEMIAGGPLLETLYDDQCRLSTSAQFDEPEQPKYIVTIG